MAEQTLPDTTPIAPYSAEIRTLAMADGAEILLRRFGRRDSTRLAVCHGNGFAIDGYVAFLQGLAAEFEVIAFDLRNHGRNPRHRAENHRLPRIVADMAEIRAGIDHSFGEKPVFGVFHSISAIAAILAADQGVGWAGLALVDPPLVPPADDPDWHTQARFEGRNADWAKQRPQAYESLDSLTRKLLATRAFGHLAEEIAAGMAAAVSRPEPGGGRELSCPGTWEAAVYLDNLDSDSLRTLGKLTLPVRLIAADPAVRHAGPPAKACRQAAERFKIDYVMVNESSHMLQLERPELTCSHIRTFTERCLRG